MWPYCKIFLKFLLAVLCPVVVSVSYGKTARHKLQIWHQQSSQRSWVFVVHSFFFFVRKIFLICFRRDRWAQPRAKQWPKWVLVFMFCSIFTRPRPQVCLYCICLYFSSWTAPHKSIRHRRTLCHSFIFSR